MTEADTQDRGLASLLAPRSDIIYLALRIVVGMLFSLHGVQKIFGLLTEHQPPVMSQVWIGGLIELAAGALIAGGVLTRWAAFIASGTMAVAYIQFQQRLAPARYEATPWASMWYFDSNLCRERRSMPLCSAEREMLPLKLFRTSVM